MDKDHWDIWSDDGPAQTIPRDSVISTITDRGSYSIKIDEEAIWNSIGDSLDDKLTKIQKEYENQLQRKAVHIGRGNQLTGRRIHGRGRKVAIRKGSFRNEKGIIGEPT